MRAPRVIGFVAAAVLAAACDDDAPSPPDAAAPDAAPQPDAAVERLDAAPPPACTITPSLECPSPAPRYADVKPIFTARCKRCHLGEEGGPWPLDTYRHIADWSSVVRDHIQHCLMPPADSGMTMPDAERRLILDWIRCDLPE